MNQSYPANYKDQHGQEITTLHNDGTLLRLTVRGVTFSGTYFDSLACQIPHNSPQLTTFNLNKGELADCEIEFDMPLLVVTSAEETQSTLHVHFQLGKALGDGRLQNEELQLALHHKGQVILSCGKHGWFEDELLELQSVLPQDTYMKCCFNCAYSDYFPAGSGVFGDMFCFRDTKEDYLAIKDKYDLLRIWDTVTEQVQETYLCPEFERRVPGTGYRG